MKIVITIHLFENIPLQFEVNQSHATFYSSEDTRPTCSALYIRIDKNASSISISTHSMTRGPYRLDPSSISSQLLRSPPLQWRRPRTHDSHGLANAMARRPPSMAAMASLLQPLVLASLASRHGHVGAPPKPVPTPAAMAPVCLCLTTGTAVRRFARARWPSPQPLPRGSFGQALSSTLATDS